MPLLPASLVSVEWLAAQHGAPNLRIVDASWHMPAAARNAAEEFAAAHIPDAVFFDLDRHSHPHSDLPHMLPDAADFAQVMTQLGIGNGDAVVVYDTSGLFSAARLWWMLRVFGHNAVAVLDGGLPQWRRHKLPVASGAASRRPAMPPFRAQLHPPLLREKFAILENLATREAVVLDARSAERFSGRVAEPRVGLRSGHIPHSRNLPYSALLTEEGLFKPRAELARLLAVEDGRTVISSCGSGVTACILDLALELTGHRHHAVYDGSWAEWGADADSPVERQ